MKVAMLVNNACVIDTRVIKQARALSDFGHEITVLCLDDGKAPIREIRDGVHYLRFPKWGVVNKIEGGFLYALRAKLASYIKKFRPSNNSKYNRNPLFPLVLFVYFIGSLIFRMGRLSQSLIFRMGRLSQLMLHKLTRSTITPSGIEYIKHCKMYSRYLEQEKFDVIHAHDLYTLPAAVLAARKSKTLVVYDSHELEMHRNAVFSKWESFIRRKIEQYCIRKTIDVITVCDSIADYLKDDYSIKRPHVIINGPDITKSQSIDNDVRRACGLTEDVPLGIYIGAVTFNRGVENCVRALQYAPEMHLALVGPRRPNTEIEILKEAEEANVRKRLHLIDPVRPEEVSPFVKTADFSLVPIQNACLSYYFCLPNKLFESALSGLPIVGARLIEVEKFLKSTQTGLVVDETNPEDIARAMREIYKNKEIYIPTAEKKQKIIDEYGWETQKIKLRKIYENLAQTV